MPLFYIYNFYFKNLIYKWIKQFENQQESSPIYFLGNVIMGVRVVFLPNSPLVLSLFNLYLNIRV